MEKLLLDISQKRRNKDFKIELGKNIKDSRRDITITSKEYSKDKSGKGWKIYGFHCNICGYNGVIKEYKLIDGQGCSCCRGLTVVPEINSVWATDKWMCDLGMSEEDAKKYTKGSHKKITVTCPDCGEEKSILVYNLYKNKSISCSCGDGYSYPEKIMVDLLNQLNINFMTQLSKTTFEWCGKYKYDFYLPYYNIIIETHGRQHYDENTNFKMSLREVQENDKYKKDLALNNNIKKYIIIDCSKSDIDYIRNNIFNSALSYIFDLNMVDWVSCEKFATTSNIIKDVCYYWKNKNENESTKDLMKKFNLHKVTVINYLKKGTKLGWCEYDGKLEMTKSGEKYGKICGKEVEVFEDNISLGVFESCSELARRSQEIFGVCLDSAMISAVAIGRRKTHKGYVFKYLSEDNVGVYNNEKIHIMEVSA